jgi:ribonuclease HI
VYTIYIDGSKDGDRVTSAAVFGQQVYSTRLPSANSIFNAEDNAIILALKFVASSDKTKFMICSDSLSCLLAIESCTTQNPFILKIVEIYKSLVAIGKHVIFTWIPSHMGPQLLTRKPRTHWMILYPIVLILIMILNL